MSDNVGTGVMFDPGKGVPRWPGRRPTAPRFPRSLCSRPNSRRDGRSARTGRCSAVSLSCGYVSTPSGGKRNWVDVWGGPDDRFGVGASDGPAVIGPWPTPRAEGGRRIFPPLDHAVVKAVACERVAETNQPISRQSLADVTARARAALGKSISRSTVWRILDRDAIKPWRYRYWIFPRDPQFVEKAGPILDLYQGFWDRQPLGPKDFIISADEKTSIQARTRGHASLPPEPGKPARIESEYERGGAVQYLAAWDVRRGYVMGRCEAKTGIVPFGRLVKQVLDQEPYASAERLFWIVDNGSSHRGEASKHRLRQVDSRLVLVHTPVHASWLNQVEIYFAIIQRKVLTPNDFAHLEAIRLRLALYEQLSNERPTPFRWAFDRTQLASLMAKIEHREHARRQLLPNDQSTRTDATQTA